MEIQNISKSELILIQKKIKYEYGLGKYKKNKEIIFFNVNWSIRMCIWLLLFNNTFV